jgi:hypothetical protein
MSEARAMRMNSSSGGGGGGDGGGGGGGGAGGGAGGAGACWATFFVHTRSTLNVLSELDIFPIRG